jgi:hypothetical protein
VTARHDGNISGMDTSDQHRFRVLMGLRKDYRELHGAAGAVVRAWLRSDYEFRGGGADPIHGLARVLHIRVDGDLDRPPE